jgi:hypothetical protein
MILTFRDHERGAPGFKGGHDVVEDQVIASRITG